MNRTRAHPAVRRRAARGVTLIETVLAVVILGLVTASFTGAMAFVYRAERNEDLRLAANELANRILLQYLDDETVVARIRNQPLDYGPSRFSWEIDVERVAMNIKEAEPGANKPRAQYKDRFEFVTVRVWLHSDAAHGRYAAIDQGPAPLAQLSRMLDPAAGRNNDAMMRLGKDQQRLMDLVMRMGIVQGAQPQNDSGGRRNNNNGNRR